MPSPSYHVITFLIDTRQTDLASGYLYDLGCLGLEEEAQKENQTYLKAYFEDKEPLSLLLNKLSNRLPDSVDLKGTTIALNSYKFQPQPFDPIQLVPGTWIVPPPDMPTTQKTPAGRQIIIRPGAAFGTGRHESTQLAAMILDDLMHQDIRSDSLIDIGAGSGILTIFAKSLGFKKVVAVEIDEEAQKNAQENLELNHLSDVKINKRVSVINDTFDIAVANILTPTLLQLKDEMLSCVKPNGFLILSGILCEERQKIMKAFASCESVKERKQNEWISLLYRKKIP